MRLARGARLGPYEVSTLLGTGGMAEVYRARDTRLGRDVALKVVSESLGGDRAFRDRFEREARLAGSVNHPNVVALYDVGLENGLPYFVTELLEGSSLRERLAKGPLTLSTALDWAVQIAEGLAAAHERGIIHRDLKPGNVFLTRDGRVKLLDFGIAKLVEAARDEVTHGLMTETVPLAGGQTGTGTGAVLGTPGYMSPEQIRGERVDARTDFFSFGAMLYEMLTGRRAFPASTLVESEHAILHTEPEPLPASLPRQVTQLVQRCLEKEPARRFQSARDLAFNLNLLRLPVDATAPLPARAGPVRRRWRWQRWGGWLALLVSLGAAVGGTFLVTRRLWAPGRAPTIDFVTSQLGDISGARFTPDGRVVLSAAWDGRPSELFVDAPGTFEGQPLGVRDVRLLSVSSKGELAVLLHPVSETLFGHEAGPGTLSIVPAAGGTPRELAVGISAADWSPAGELAVVRLVGGKRRLEFPMGTAILETTDYLISPRVSPRGDLVAVIHIRSGAPDELLLVDRKGQVKKLRTSPVAQTSPEQATPTKLAWLPSGDEVWFSTDNALWGAPLAGTQRLVYQAVAAIALEDISRTGTVLLNIRNERDELGFLGPDEPRERRLSSFGSVVAQGLVSLSEDGRRVFFTEQVNGLRAYLRPTDGSPAVRLGVGDALALSPDQRWVLIAPAESQ
ncbi:MAG TPA: serine/threonine-protein kinase, partial [Myxococcaceae bacterium]|nr:serine/threonine-protein kinase [Myxococcaceae bacterium]